MEPMDKAEEGNAPRIDVLRLKVGTRLFVETEHNLYEMKVVVPGLLEISSTDPALHQPTVGKFIGSRRMAFTQQFDTMSRPQRLPSNDLPGRIAKGASMHIHFRNGEYLSTPVASAEVRGDNWYYLVF
jgi:hypothetical protein